MSRNWLKPTSLFLISCRINGELYYLTNSSPITNVIRLDKHLKYAQITNFLFKIEAEGQFESNIPRKFHEPLLIKHKYSNKYLNFAEEMGEKNHEGCKLVLSHQKIRWSASPCFKYQIKNTENIEFSERIYITQQYYQSNSAKGLFIKEDHNEEDDEMSYEMLFGFNSKSQIILVRYHEQDGASFHFGQCLKIYHQESYAYLVDSTPVSKIFQSQQEEAKKSAIAFKNQLQSIGETQLDSIWIVEQAITIKGAQNINGTMTMQVEIRLKNLFTEKYLTLEDHSTDDENFLMVGDKEESIYSIFKLEAVKAGDRVITKECQARMKHSIIYQYMAVSQYRESHALIDIKMDKIPQDEHFYQFQPISFQIQLTIFFLVALKKELLHVNRMLTNQINLSSLTYIKQLHLSIEIDLKEIEKLSNFDLLKSQLNRFIPLIINNIVMLQQAQTSDSSKIVSEIIRLNYNLLIEIAKNNEKNKATIFRYIHIITPHIFEELLTQQLMIEVLKNNMKLLSQLADYNEHLKCNIIEAIMKKIDHRMKDQNYWKKMMKVIDLLHVMVKNYDSFIDLNQRIIAMQLFGQNKSFNNFFFKIKIKKSHIYINHPITNIQMPINNFRQPSARQIIIKVLSLITSLCEDRNIISKKFIENYLNLDQDNPNLLNDWTRSQDLKAIINCFYIRNQGGLRSKIFLLLASLYVDSFPRINRYKPINVIKLDINSMKITQSNNAAAELAELSSRLKDSIMMKAERSYYSRPLSALKSDHSNWSARSREESTFTNNQINEYKKIVLLLLETEIWTIQILRILRMLINLGILTSEEKINIYNKFFEQIKNYSNNSLIIKELLLIIDDLLKILKEDNLQKMKLYLILMHFKGREKLEPTDIKHMMCNEVIRLNKIKQTPTNQFIITKYNQMANYINQYYQSPKIIQNFISIFLQNQYQPQITLKFMECVQIMSTPYAQTSRLLLNTSILGQEDLNHFTQLESYSIQINNLTQISEEWLCNNEQNSPNYLRFTHLMDQVTNFLFQDYVLEVEEGIKYRKKHKINKFRQIIAKNIGMHEYVLYLLNSNDYLIEGETLRTLKKKIRITFQKCFDFLYWFCYQCEENKDTLFLEMVIINKYINLLEVGQTQLWIHLIKNKKKLIQQITIEDIQKIIFKIVKDRISTSYLNCDYNPLYIDQLMTLIDINGVPFKPNIQKIAKVLEQPLILKKFLYLSEDKKKRNEFCLQLYKLRIDPTQVPVIYHAKMIELLIYMMKQLGNKNSFLRRAFKNLISLDYLFYLAAIDDAFTHQGIPTDMNFVLKIEVFKVLNIYLAIKDTENEVYQSIQITKFLEYYKNAFALNSKRKQSMVDNQMLYYSYIQKYEEIIQNYIENSHLFYNKYLKKILIKLEEILSKVPNADQDQNYQLVLFLLDENRLHRLNKSQQLKQNQKQTQLYIKWSNFMPMSSSSTHQENMTKHLLYQFLTNQRTKQYLEEQKKLMFERFQKREEEFILRIKSILNKISENFQDFHQKPLSNLIKLLHQYIIFKVNKPKDIFSRQPPSLILSQSLKQLIIPLITLLSAKSFDYNRIFCQKILHSSFIIIYHILSFEVKFDHHELILRYCQDQNENGVGLLKSLRKAVIEMISEENIHTVIQQINFAQSSLLLIPQEQKIEPLLSSLLFIKELCRYQPFTIFLRGQQGNPFDFLDLIYTNLLTILSEGAQTLNIVKVRRIQYLCQAIAFFFNGCNKTNQSVVVNKQFVKYVESFMKIDQLKQKQDGDGQEKSTIDQIALNYRQIIPQYGKMLKHQLEFFRFRSFYVMNCVKTELIKVLLASTISNEDSIQKLKAYMSVELIKLNIIILHERALNYKKKAKQSLFLERFQNWREIYNNEKEYKMSFTMSTYGFFLIKVLQGELTSQTTHKQSNNNKPKDEIGQMGDFLPQSMKLLLKELKDEPFFRDILLFYTKYFQAYQYFKHFFLNIEIAANTQEQIVDIIIPKLPLCEQFGEDKLYDLQYESNRLNQQQKNKSFIILTQHFYQQISGDIQFNKKMTDTFPFSIFLINIFKKSDIFYTFFCIINIILALLHLLANFQLYSSVSTFESFQDQVFVFYNPKTFIRSALIMVQLLNLTMCTLLIMFLVVKKMPFYFYLHLKAYHKLSPKQKIGASKYQLSYGVINLIKTVFLDLFLFTFASLTIIHPMFSAFVMLYLLTRLELGKILIKMIRELYLELLVVTGVLIVFNYCYAIFIYVNLTVDTSYGSQCVDMFICMKLFMDQIIKGGFVTLLPSNYVNDTINLQFFTEYSYNLLVPGVLIEIFRGLNIDKMSYFRQRNESIEKDQKEKCYICGQKQFQIDLNLEGYEKHIKSTHNRFNYIAFIFYLRRKNNQKYLFYQDLVRNCLAQTKYSWIPLETSIKKQKLVKEEEKRQSFETNLISILEQKETLTRKTLFNAKKTHQQMKIYFNMENVNIDSPSLLSPSSPAKSKFSSSKTFRRN